MKYTINDEGIVFDEHYKMLKANVSYDTFAGARITANRFAFHRGDSVAILLFEKDTSSILVTKQFRYPTTKHQIGWIYEVPAGSLEEDECPLTCAIRETQEELGYRIHQPQQISNFYTSPGGSTERCYLFYTEVNQKDKIGKGGGVDSESEDIKTVKIPISEIDTWLSTKIFDAKTIIALQWFAMHKI